MLQAQCPSLASVSDSDISLQVRFDGDARAVQDVVFRVMPEAWPTAVTAVLPLVHILLKPSTGRPTLTAQAHASARERLAGGDERQGAKTWEDLKREGALLGVHGSTDRSKL